MRRVVSKTNSAVNIEIPRPLLILGALLLLGGLIFAGMSLARPEDGSKVRPDDYLYEPGELREKLKQEEKQ
jgi:hypothetical protein